MIKITETDGCDEDFNASYAIKIEQDGKTIAGFHARDLAMDCPEDATLGRSMSFAYDAIKFFKLGYEAGKAGEEVVFEEKKEEEE